jgi:hypothetical protein
MARLTYSPPPPCVQKTTLPPWRRSSSRGEKRKSQPLPVTVEIHSRGHQWSVCSGSRQPILAMRIGRGAIRICSATHPRFDHWRCGGVSNDSVHMAQARRRKEKRSDWWFIVEHIGRELRKIYPPVDVPPGLRALFTEERRRASAADRNDQGDDNAGRRVRQRRKDRN